MRRTALDRGDLGHRKCQIKIERAVFLHGGIIRKFLVEVIRRHGQNHQTLGSVGILKGLQIIILTGKPAKRRRVDHQHRLARETVQIDRAAIDGVEPEACPGVCRQSRHETGRKGSSSYPSEGHPCLPRRKSVM